MNTNPEQTKSNPVIKWGIAIVVVVVLFLSGFFIAKATIEPTVNTVEKEVIKTEYQLPIECHKALLAYESYGKNMDSIAYTYGEFIASLEDEFNGVSTPQSTYQAYGMTIGLSKELAQEQADLLETLIPACNKYS